MKIKTIIISNIAEAFEDTINKVENDKQKKDRIIIEHNLCDRTLLWEGDNKIVITPFQISKEIFILNKIALGFKNVDNLYPGEIDISLSDAIKKDRELLKNLCQIIKDNPGVRITPYCITNKFVSLTEYFKSKGLDFDVMEMPPEESVWLASYLDSKVGSRIEIGRIKSIHENVPESIVCKSHEEVLKVAVWFYVNNRSCALKSNFGESGWGTIFIKKEDFDDKEGVIRYIKKEFKVDSIWSDELILVEEYIVSNKKMSGASPSVELFLSDDDAEITYLCNQVLGKGGDFLGVALGKNLLNNKTRNKLLKISNEVGKKFQELGYRGFFDIDFILSNNNVPYIIETNMRRTGGTHVYDTAKTLLGNYWEDNYFIMSQDNFCYGNKELDEKQAMDKMKEILYPIKGKKEGTIISILNKQEATFGFIIVGESRKKALKIYDKILDIWGIKK
ncbi:MAG: hypothetical protein UR51_C0008G0049 [Candidatus Moranbacteria bacterium GW2011_GWF1_34_10]|nr:MAG: hypothetical protein UR51_C0008G0049 [Candidatus Moranbacteria bacterium GW2011_GWF1_34_10]